MGEAVADIAKRLVRRQWKVWIDNEEDKDADDLALPATRVEACNLEEAVQHAVADLRESHDDEDLQGLVLQDSQDDVFYLVGVETVPKITATRKVSRRELMGDEFDGVEP